VKKRISGRLPGSTGTETSFRSPLRRAPIRAAWN
jgi:hypothetical protein